MNPKQKTPQEKRLLRSQKRAKVAKMAERTKKMSQFGVVLQQLRNTASIPGEKLTEKEEAILVAIARKACDKVKKGEHYSIYEAEDEVFEKIVEKRWEKKDGRKAN